MKRFLQIIFFFLLLPFLGLAQHRQTPKFNTIKIPIDTLDNISAHQWDKEGNLWFITSGKLGKYNSNSFTIYEHQPNNSNSLLKANIASVYQDKDGIFWLGYMEEFALTKFDPSNDQYTHFYADSNSNESIPYAPIVRIKPGQKDELLLFSWGGGFSRFNKRTEKVINYHKRENPDSTWIQSNRIKDGVYLDEDRLLFGYFREGGKKHTTPAILNTKNNTITPFPYEQYIDHYDKELKSILKRNLKIINFIHVDANKNIWFGSYSSLFFFNTKTKKAQRIVIDSSLYRSLNIVNARTGIEDKQGRLWVNTFNSGVLLVDINTLEAQYLKHDPNDPSSIGVNVVGHINIDPMDNVWVDIGKNEYSVYNPYLQNFDLIPWIDLNLKFTNNSAQIIPVNQMYVQPSGLIYISSSNGLHTYNTKTKESKTILNPKFKEYNTKLNFDASNLVNNFKIRGEYIYFDNKWSLYAFNTKTNAVKLITKGKYTPTFRHHDEGDSLFFNYYGQTYYYNKALNSIQIFDTIKGMSSHVENNRVLKDGRWIIGAEKNHFTLYDPNKKESIKFSNDSVNHHFPGESIVSTYVDTETGLLWIGTVKTIFTFNPNTFEFIDQSKNLGIYNETAQAFIRDLNGNLWIAIGKDLLIYKKDGSTFRYTTDFGVNAGEFLPSVAQMDHTGRIYMASLNGIVNFHPDELRFSDFPFIIKIDKLFVNGDSYPFSSNDFSQKQPLLFSWDENFISFEFSNSQIYEETPHQYFYRIKGIHKNWQSNGTSNSIRFSGLSYGDYILEIKAVNTYDQESEILTLHFTIKKPFWLTIWFYAIIAIVLGVAIFFWVKQREKRMIKQKEVLEETVKLRTAEVVEKAEEISVQKDIIEAKNLELTDSIVYAERIQKAILPPDERVQNLLQDAFVLYKPKDIIAGDFYFLETVEDQDRIIFAAADCTGHGVPGAIVSVICNNALQRSLRENHMIHPANILNHSRDLIVHEFDKGGKDVKDGMDIALVSIPQIRTDAFEIEYAGANNAIWILRSKEGDANSMVYSRNKESTTIAPNRENDTHVLFEIKPDKQPIGKYIDPQPFVNNKIKVQKGDTLYVFSDGFADQFGSFDHGKPDKKGGKKLKTANFKKMILSIQELSIKDQKEYLDSAFEKWRGNIEQIDDVCVIGMRL